MLDRVRPCTAPARATIDPRFRKKIETAIERLIGLLDATEPDHDIEDGDDAEAVNDDAEPTLGAPEHHHDQREWALGAADGQAGDEREDDGEGLGIEGAFYGRERREAGAAASRDAKVRLRAIVSRKSGKPAAGRDEVAILSSPELGPVLRGWRSTDVTAKTLPLLTSCLPRQNNRAVSNS